MGFESIIGLICGGIIVIAFMAAYIQHKFQKRTAETIRNASGDDIARIRALVEARDNDKISDANFHEEIARIRNRQTQSTSALHQHSIQVKAPRHGEIYNASLIRAGKRKRIKARSTLSNRMVLIIAIFLVLVFLILTDDIGANPTNRGVGSARAVATATSLSTRQPPTAIRKTQAIRATTAPVAYVEPQLGVLYAFHSEDFDDESEPETLPIANLGSFYLPPSDVRYEFTRHASGYAEVRLLDLSGGCLPHGGKDMAILPFGPNNPTVYLLSQGQGCRFNVQIEWFGSTWSFWISNASITTARRAEPTGSSAAVSTQSISSAHFSITQVAPKFAVMVGGEVNLRAGPGTQYSRIGSILGGNTLEVIGSVNGESIQGDNQWYLVSYRDDTAFIAKALTVRTN